MGFGGQCSVGLVLNLQDLGLECASHAIRGPDGHHSPQCTEGGDRGAKELAIRRTLPRVPSRCHGTVHDRDRRVLLRGPSVEGPATPEWDASDL